MAADKGIKFMDGTFLTYEYLALRIEKEGKLCTSALNNGKGVRCAMGAIIQTRLHGNYNDSPLTADISKSFRKPRSNAGKCLAFVDKVVRENNNFIGTQEARATHIAAFLRDLS